jgi:formate hydrogenlyase subunit 3/multisubunit Na+/H+ antiporter MnhD subunit
LGEDYFGPGILSAMNGFFAPMILPIVLLLPLLLAAILVFKESQPLVLRLAPWAALPALVLSLAPDFSVQLPWLLLGTELGMLDESGRLFLLFTALLWLLSGLYAKAYFAGQQSGGRFFVYFLLAMTGNLGLILALDVASFFLFFALMSFSSYGLVVHERTAEALHAARIYMILVVIGEIALFSAMTMAASVAETYDFATIRNAVAMAESRDLIILLALVGFGIKAGVLGLHVWLPLAHPVAPTPASAVLSGAMIKAGLLGWLRLLPMGEAVLVSWGETFMLLGVLAAFYAVVVGLTQRDPKTLLAYSSISQMGILTMAVGVGLARPDDYPAIIAVISLYALHHGLNKGALFLGVGLVKACSGSQLRKVWLLLWLPALALAGAPLTSGMLAKVLLKAQTVNAPEGWAVLLKILLPLSSVATTLLVGRFLYLLVKLHKQAAHSSPGALGRPWGLLVAGSAILPWWLVADVQAFWTQNAFLNSLWPVLPGVLLTVAAIRWQPAKKNLFPSIPAGDVLAPVSRCLVPAFKLCRALAIEKLPHWLAVRRTALGELQAKQGWGEVLGRAETGLNRWPVAMIILILIGLTVAIVASGS